MADSTSISSLTTNNVSLTTTEKPPVQENSETMSADMTQSSPQLVHKPVHGLTELSSKTIKDIVSGIQNASQKGMTSLQSRDIPRDTVHLTQDPEVKPSFIPEPQQQKYIEQHDSYNSLIEQNKKVNKSKSKMDNIYDEIQTPLLAMMMFFFFQMPYFTKLMRTQMPSLINSQGFPTLSGNLFRASLFGLGFYGITKFSNYLSDM